jgi:hypothetical protein
MPSSSATDFFHQKMMDFVLKGAPLVPVSTLWIGLFTTVPALTGSGGVEVSVSSTGYGRVAVVSGTGSQWQGPTGATKDYTNSIDLQYAIPTANWGNILGAGIFDAETGGNLLYVGTLTTAKQVNNGDGAPRILAGQLKISRATC